MTPSAEEEPQSRLDTLLTVSQVSKHFGGLAALQDVSLHIHTGEIYGLIGPNGAGKTTVFNCITGFYKPSEGRLGLRHGDASVIAPFAFSGVFFSSGWGFLFWHERPDTASVLGSLLVIICGIGLLRLKKQAA